MKTTDAVEDADLIDKNSCLQQIKHWIYLVSLVSIVYKLYSKLMIIYLYIVAHLSNQAGYLYRGTLLVS